MKKKEQKLIKRFKLKNMGNALYMSFMQEVNHFIEMKTPLALGISGYYPKFLNAYEVAKDAWTPRMKHPLTAELARLHERRKDCLRCLKGHIWADLDNDDPALREHARILRNKLESYGDMMRVGRTAFTPRATDLGADLSVEPLAEHVEKLGQMANVRALIEANKAYSETKKTRSKSKMNFVPNAFRNARRALDEAYHRLVEAINAQIIACQVIDSPAVGNIEELEDFARIINVLIREFRTEMKQSGPAAEKTAGDQSA